jgi:8-oxo-dGTP pyrophosphatase MutT (NUDIX family)
MGNLSRPERETLDELAARLRAAVAKPLPSWREVYEGFSPRDLETGERRSRSPGPGEGARRAAVLVPVLPAPEGARLLYTVRTDALRDHAGQVSFPGGSLEPGDGSPRETALREAEEEVDLRPGLVEIIGELDEVYIPPSDFLVRPVLGLLRPEAQLIMAPEEVEEIFSVPLSELISPMALKEVVWEREGRLYEVRVFAVGGYEIWGATAAMTAGLLARLGWNAEGITGT